MEIGYTMLERAILGLSGAAYCTGYSYAAWYFLKRNHRADEIPGMFRALTVLLLFLSSVLSLWQEHALLYAGTGMVILIILSVGAYQRSRTGIVETLLFAMAVFGSYLIFTLLLQLLWFGFGSAVAMKVGEWYFLWRSAIYLILAAEYILISRYFVKVFRGKDQVLLTKGQTMIFLVFPFLMLGLLFGLYLGGDTLMLIYGYSSIAVIAFGIVLLHLLVTYLFGYMMEQQKKMYEQKQRLEMNALQAQINPHFLYNTLDSIRWMAVFQDAENIADTVMSLEELLRNMAKGVGDKISLREELSLVEDYVRLQQVRYMEIFDYVCDVPEKYLDYQIVKMSMQPIIENAILHGIVPSGTYGEVKIFVRETKTDLYVSVEDNGIGIDKEEFQKLVRTGGDKNKNALSGIGIMNVDERLRMTYGEDYGLIYEGEKGKFARVTIHIPKDTGEDDDV